MKVTVCQERIVLSCHSDNGIKKFSFYQHILFLNLVFLGYFLYFAFFLLKFLAILMAMGKIITSKRLISKQKVFLFALRPTVREPSHASLEKIFA